MYFHGVLLRRLLKKRLERKWYIRILLFSYYIDFAFRVVWLLFGIVILFSRCGMCLVPELCSRSVVAQAPDVSWIFVRWFFLRSYVCVERIGLFDHGFGLRLLELGCCYYEGWSEFTYGVRLR